MQDAGSGMQDPGCGMQDPGCGMGGSGCRIRGAGCGVRGAGFGMRDAGSGMRGAGSGVRDPGCRMQDPGCGVQDPGCGVQDPGCGVQDAGCGVQDAGCGVRDAGCSLHRRGSTALRCQRGHRVPHGSSSSPPPYRPFIDHSLPERAPLHFHGSSTFPHTRGCHASPCARNEPLRIAKPNSLLRAELSKSSQALPDPGQGHAAAFRPLCSQIHNLHLHHPWIFPGTALRVPSQGALQHLELARQIPRDEAFPAH